MKHIKFLGLCFLALGIVSCDSDEAEIATVDVGGNAVLSDRSITVLDQNSDVSISLLTDGQTTFESVEIVDADGNVLTTATISGETATFNTSALGEFIFGEDNDEVTGSFPIRINSVLSNGSVLSDPYSIAVDHAIELGEVDQVFFMDPTTNAEDEDIDVELEYEVSTFSAPIDSFDLEWKIGEEGTYVTEEDIDLSTAEGGGVIDFSTLHYLDYGVEPGDTLYYRFTATSGSLMDQVETSVVIEPQSLEATTTATLSDDAAASQLDLTSGEVSAEGSETGDIAFLSPTGFEVIGAESDLQFVQVTEEDFFGTADLMDVRAAFEAGTPVTSVTDVENGDVFVYKVTRQVEIDDEGTTEDVVVYGIIQVGNVTVVDGTAVSFDLEFSEGTIVD